MGKSAWSRVPPKKERSCSFFWTSAPILLFFAYTSLRSKVEANWPALAYFSAWWRWPELAFGRMAGWGRGKRVFAWAAALIGLLFTVLAHLQPIYAVVPIPAGIGSYQPAPRMACAGRATQGAAGSLDPARREFSSSPPAISWRARGCFTPGGKFRCTNGMRPSGSTTCRRSTLRPAGSQSDLLYRGRERAPPGAGAPF